jgi:hypothetical protein
MRNHNSHYNNQITHHPTYFLFVFHHSYTNYTWICIVKSQSQNKRKYSSSTVLFLN